MKSRRKRELPLHLMILPSVIMLICFSYLPMGGIIIAFQKFIPAKGLFGDQKWIGFDNFIYLFKLPNFTSVLWNTLFIAVMKIIFGLLIPIVVAILINEVRHNSLKKAFRRLSICLTFYHGWY